jgi:hypothetical protein
MLDKIVIQIETDGSGTATLIFSNREPYRLVSDVDIVSFLDEFLAPPNFDTLSQYETAVAHSQDDTQEIDVSILDNAS